jgi:hypothetical protein
MVVHIQTPCFWVVLVLAIKVGVEPASEERTIAISYAHIPSFVLHLRATEGQVDAKTTLLSPLSRCSPGARRGCGPK